MAGPWKGLLAAKQAAMVSLKGTGTRFTSFLRGSRTFSGGPRTFDGIMPVVGLGAGLLTAKSINEKLVKGTKLTNPIMPQAAGYGYGKRGLDGNNLNTDGLVQSLHKGRRNSR